MGTPNMNYAVRPSGETADPNDCSQIPQADGATAKEQIRSSACVSEFVCPTNITGPRHCDVVNDEKPNAALGLRARLCPVVAEWGGNQMSFVRFNIGHTHKIPETISLQ